MVSPSQPHPEGSIIDSIFGSLLPLFASTEGLPLLLNDEGSHFAMGLPLVSPCPTLTASVGTAAPLAFVPVLAAPEVATPVVEESACLLRFGYPASWTALVLQGVHRDC